MRLKEMPASSKWWMPSLATWVALDLIQAHRMHLTARARPRGSETALDRARLLFDLVVAGCAILDSVLRTWPASILRVADRGLREGILHGLMGHTLEAALHAQSRPSAPLMPPGPLAIGAAPA